jgi:hypothetical protein
MLSAAVMGPSQFFTLDASCWYGCQATGAGNCEEICQAPSYSVTGTGTPPTTKCQWYESANKEGQCKFPSTAAIMLGAFGIVALIVVSR